MKYGIFGRKTDGWVSLQITWTAGLKLNRNPQAGLMINTPDQKAANIQAYQEREGIALENVAKNPGRKIVAKLMLNRWGT